MTALQYDEKKEESRVSLTNIAHNWFSNIVLRHEEVFASLSTVSVSLFYFNNPEGPHDID